MIEADEKKWERENNKIIPGASEEKKPFQSTPKHNHINIS